MSRYDHHTCHKTDIKFIFNEQANTVFTIPLYQSIDLHDEIYLFLV